jgi:hypothetical protein
LFELFGEDGVVVGYDIVMFAAESGPQDAVLDFILEWFVWTAWDCAAVVGFGLRLRERMLVDFHVVGRCWD